MRAFGHVLTAALALSSLAFFEVSASERTTIKFPSARLFEKDTDTRTIEGVLFKPDGPGPFPAVVLLHANSGVDSNLTEDWSGYLTGLGYVVLIPRSNHSRGVPKGTWGNLQQRLLLLMKDGYGSLDALAALPDVDANRVGVMGFSLGAMAINQIIYGWKVRALSGREFKAAIPLYGTCDQIRAGYDPKVNVPVLQIIAELDNQKDLKGKGRGRADYCIEMIPLWGMEMLVLEGAHHAFDNQRVSGRHDPGGNWMEFSFSATRKAREATRDFFSKHLGK